MFVEHGKLRCGGISIVEGAWMNSCRSMDGHDYQTLLGQRLLVLSRERGTQRHIISHRLFPPPPCAVCTPLSVRMSISCINSVSSFSSVEFRQCPYCIISIMQYSQYSSILSTISTSTTYRSSCVHWRESIHVTLYIYTCS